MGIKMSKPPLFFVAVVVLIAVLATHRYFSQRSRDAENDRQPVRVTQVEVKEKRETPSTQFRSRQREEMVNEPMRYDVVFHPLRGGEDIRVRLKQKQYEQIEQGAQGMLSMQGTRFVSFSPQAK
jgi:Protein of unknown function (DUF2500)